ncbi:SIS domain-containing protein [Mesorhizobium sp. LHD-90]|uniref:SIS domain-containing protein n=1 Tax=Mesorhizobium sp. LHD-90 TaxID=3071414 RepID=UPI0027E13FE1|nr:SIS domain-containing protein [Mesorhizobium sp. LHD-90]MDQ6433834.1 SIS domain-containing protein [Mesorhizobium sp. LHD-90]
MSYRSTVARQPESIAACIEAARGQVETLDLAPFSSGQIAVTGIGASFAASAVVAGELARNGRRAVALRSVDLIDAGDAADAIIALSHRGRSVETVDSLKKHPGAAKLAITNSETSPLAEAAGRHIRLENGPDATPSSTGYTGTLAAAGLLTEKLCGASGTDWSALPQTVRDTLERAAEKMPRLGKLFNDRRAIDCVGAVSSLGTADGASLLIREAARIPAGATDTRHYLHGPMESMDSRTGVVVFGDGREVQMALQLEEIGCPVLLVTSNQDVSDKGVLAVMRVPALQNRIARGIVDILAAQLLAAELSDAAGLTDTKFRYRQTDTKIPVAA